MITCVRFLDEYSSFRDGELPTWEMVAFRAHLSECHSCERYHRVVCEGVEVLRTLPELEVSSDFGARLQHRIWHEEMDRSAQRRRARTARLSGAIGIAAAGAGVAIGLGMRGESGGPDALPPAAMETGIGAYQLDVPHVEAGSVTSELARLGVRVYELPYHDVVYRRDATLVASLAEYAGDPVPTTR